MSYLNRPMVQSAALVNLVRNTGLMLLTLTLVACGSQDQAAAPETATETATEAVSSAAVKGSVEHIREVTNISDDAIAAADSTPGNWLSYGRGYKEDRYSELEQITPDNLEELGLAWTIELGTKRGLQATPIVVDGIMYVTGSWSVVWAIDVRKGEVIWKYDPKVPTDTALILCCGTNNRGVALYEGSVYFGTLDGRLVALDAADGSLQWEVMTVPEDSFYSITGAPRIVKGRVVIGNGGAEFNARGYVTAYDTKSGEQAWRFYTVPGDPAKPDENTGLDMARKTWTGDDYWKQGGGGTVWDAIVYDPELNLVYIGVGNGSHWNREIRSPDGGDTLFVSSVVALNADTGDYVWHFQTTPGDTWDYTATQHIILADIEIDGAERKVLMQAPKNGFFYVLDRATGEFISGDNYTYVNWASGLDENGRPIEVPGKRYTDGKIHWIAPSSHGGHNWPPMSYNHKTGLVYIPTAQEAQPYSRMEGVGYGSKDTLAGSFGGNISLANKTYLEQVFDTNPDAPTPGVTSGRLIAWDPIKQERVWGVEQPYHYNGGLLTTSTGLVMQADAEGMFSIRDASTGEALWQFDIRAGGVAAPATYMVDGEQYITLAVGWGGIQGMLGKRFSRLHPGTIYTWKLGGTAEAPAKLPAMEKAYSALTTDADELSIGRGFDTFVSTCSGCHLVGEGGGAAPDLSRSADGIFAIYPQIILEGALATQGMPKFGHILNEQDVADIKAYVIDAATQFRNGAKPTDLDYLTRMATLQYAADQAKAAAAAAEDNQ